MHSRHIHLYTILFSPQQTIPFLLYHILLYVFIIKKYSCNPLILCIIHSPADAFFRASGVTKHNRTNSSGIYISI